MVSRVRSALRVMTVVGTRPEIIRLSRVIEALDQLFDHVLVHTGQNYDFELKEVFFKQMRLRSPDHVIKSDPTTLGSLMADVLKGTERLIDDLRPNALVVLGDTNSSISVLMARRMQVPVYHLEAGNRSFDPNVPEEVNRKMVDHVADYHLVYSEHSRRNLLAEGLDPQTIVLVGSPMREILEHYADDIEVSDVLTRLGLQAGGFILASAHREENVDDLGRLQSLVTSLVRVGDEQDCPVLVSTHPRTRKRMEQHRVRGLERLHLHKPLGFFDYIKLQTSARCVISDSGTVSEEAIILGFPAVTVRDAIERPEAIDVGGIISTGVEAPNVAHSVAQTLWARSVYPVVDPPAEYQVRDTSRRVVNLIRSTASTHHRRRAIRRSDRWLPPTTKAQD